MYIFRYSAETIVRNSAKCAYCGTELESKFRHDFQGHSCVRPDGTEAYFAVDGGKAYVRRAFKHRDDYIDTSIIDAVEDEGAG